jgi:RHS repeat-associated protein
MTDAYGNPLPINPNASIAGSGSSSNPEKNQTKTLPQNLLTGGAGVLYLQRIRMYNMRRRFYVSLLYRFLSIDPIQPDKHDYIYAFNNPLNFSDPSGLASIGENGSFPEPIIGLGFPGINYNFKMAMTNVEFALNKKSCRQAMKCYCAEKITYYDIDTLISQLDMSFIYNITNHRYKKITVQQVKKSYAIAATNISYYPNVTFSGELLVGASEAYIGRVIAHEMGHYSQCHIGVDKYHACCNLIASECGFNTD